MKTTLQKALERYLVFRRSLGFKLKDHGRALPKFITFLHSHDAEFITTELALTWAQQPQDVQQAHHAKRLSMVRDFARYLSASDPRTQIPPQGLLPAQPQRTQPYIYSSEELLDLIQEASRLQPPDAIRPHTYSTLFGLLAVSGMRISEAVGLDCSDVDLDEGILTIRESKFNKTRIIPVHSSTQHRLRTYGHRRDRLLPVRSSPGFFVSDRTTRLHPDTVRYTFIRVSRQVGLRGATDSHGPRLQDMRHTFAVRTLINWHRAGIDPEQRLPLLSAYLGHAKVSDTYWYLSAVPELMEAVSTRLDNLFGAISCKPF